MFVRTDIPVAQQIVQACHAAFEAGGKFVDTHGPFEGLHLVLCALRHQQDLEKALHWLDSHGIPFTVFQEPDLDNMVTAVATAPVDDSKKRLFVRFRLWTGQALPTMNKSTETKVEHTQEERELFRQKRAFLRTALRSLQEMQRAAIGANSRDKRRRHKRPSSPFVGHAPHHVYAKHVGLAQQQANAEGEAIVVRLVFDPSTNKHEFHSSKLSKMDSVQLTEHCHVICHPRTKEAKIAAEIVKRKRPEKRLELRVETTILLNELHELRGSPYRHNENFHSVFGPIIAPILRGVVREVLAAPTAQEAAHTLGTRDRELVTAVNNCAWDRPSRLASEATGRWITYWDDARP